jgi:hypothetical protein
MQGFWSPDSRWCQEFIRHIRVFLRGQFRRPQWP